MSQTTVNIQSTAATITTSEITENENRVIFLKKINKQSFDSKHGKCGKERLKKRFSENMLL